MLAKPDVDISFVQCNTSNSTTMGCSFLSLWHDTSNAVSVSEAPGEVSPANANKIEPFPYARPVKLVTSNTGYHSCTVADGKLNDGITDTSWTILCSGENLCSSNATINLASRF